MASRRPAALSALPALACALLLVIALLTIGPPDTAAIRFFVARVPGPTDAARAAALLCWLVISAALMTSAAPLAVRRRRRGLKSLLAVLVAAAGLGMLAAGLAHHFGHPVSACCADARSVQEALRLARTW